MSAAPTSTHRCAAATTGWRSHMRCSAAHGVGCSTVRCAAHLTARLHRRSAGATDSPNTSAWSGMRHGASHCAGLAAASVSLERRCAHATGVRALHACVVWRAREPRSFVRSCKRLARAGEFAAANFAAIYTPHSSLLRALLEGASLAALTDEPLLATSCARR